MPTNPSHWQVWIDTGGTFTDCVACDPEGRIARCKVLSNGCLRGRIVSVEPNRSIVIRVDAGLPDGFLAGFRLAELGGEEETEIIEHSATEERIRVADDGLSFIEPGRAVELRSGEEAPLLAARWITGSPPGSHLPPMAMRLATTRGTNALLERRGAPTAHFITRGFEDLLAIGTQQRPDLFALHIEREPPLPEICIGVPGRIGPDGRVIEELDCRQIEEAVDDLVARGVRCASIALLHAHRNPIHEQNLAAYLRDRGFRYVAPSSELSPFQGLLRRSHTSAVDAYLGPVIADYLDAVAAGMDRDRSTLHVMTSAGGLVSATAFRPMESLLSGPAGGVVGAALTGRIAEAERIIAFDMGGTSTDVSRFDGDFEYMFTHHVGPVELAAPALAIETVAAGGGSICRVEHGRLVVGPQSAGAQPGPASYGAGGPLTLTDVNLLLGRLAPDRFPIPIDVGAARRRFGELRHELSEAGSDSGSDEGILEGLLRIADERMAEAIRRISVRKGIDPADYSLVAFGGAGGQHACRVAEILGMKEVLVPGHAGLLSALGLGDAVVERFAQREILAPLPTITNRLEEWFEELAAEATEALAREGIARNAIDTPRRIVALRYVGQDATIEIEPDGAGGLSAAFEDEYFQRFAYRPKARTIELVTMRVVARSRRRAETAGDDPARLTEQTRRRFGSVRCFVAGKWRDVACFDAELLELDAGIEGPILIFQEHSAVVVPPGWSATSIAGGGVRLSSIADDGEGPGGIRATRPGAVELELMSHRFTSIAREMGEMLRRTAVSTNIKEREDFSCTLLDPGGRLVVNAPHIPVHLGAMGLCVRELAAQCPMHPGDVVATNHPAFGGSHLPDVTLVAPVHQESGLVGYVACRAHHAEIGGVRPGSVPPDARYLIEEGVVLPPTLLFQAGEPRWEPIVDLLTGGPWPTRALTDNLADLRAMLAAIIRGRNALMNLASAVGVTHIHEHMDALRRQARRQVREALARLPDGVHIGRQKLDDGSPLTASFEVCGDRATLDFRGSAPVHPGNLNATPAIVHSVTMYVMRLMVDVELPLNEGLLEPIEIRIPSGLLNPPFVDDPSRCPAVVGGNVETSQRLVDTLFDALRLAASSQGTMNNISFGDDSFGYYETIGGGAGAGNGYPGASGVHSHMTNTRITDPEVLEHRYPVRLRRFELRTGSGGSGRWKGGDGLIREFEFLAPVSLSILSQHRIEAPFGLAGGKPGAVGRQVVVTSLGTRHELAGIDGWEMQRGDRLVLETPGGGGYGAEDEGEER